MSNDCMLTTIDNPYDPFEQFALWLMFDKEKGYDSCERLARIVEPKITNDMSEYEINEVTESAMNDLIRDDFLNVFTKAYRKTNTYQYYGPNEVRGGLRKCTPSPHRAGL